MSSALSPMVLAALALATRHAAPASRARGLATWASSPPPPVRAHEVCRHWRGVTRAAEELALCAWFGQPVASDVRLASVVLGLALQESERGELRAAPSRMALADALAHALSAGDERAARDALHALAAADASGACVEHLAALSEGLSRAAHAAGGLDTLASALGCARGRASLARVECVDISHLHGRHTVGAFSVLAHGAPALSAYGCVEIEHAGPANDPAAIHEALLARLGAAARAEAPSLLLVDGGRPQLGAAQRALEALGGPEVSLAALAKQEELLFVPGRAEPLALPLDSPALLTMRRLRDEAHATALLHHRALRHHAEFTSVLDGLGLGVRGQRALREAFGTATALCRASADELRAAAPEHLGRDDAAAVAAALAAHRREAAPALAQLPELLGGAHTGYGGHESAVAAVAASSRRSGRAVAAWMAEARARRWWEQRRGPRVSALESELERPRGGAAEQGDGVVARLARALCAVVGHDADSGVAQLEAALAAWHPAERARIAALGSASGAGAAPSAASARRADELHTNETDIDDIDDVLEEDEEGGAHAAEALFGPLAHPDDPSARARAAAAAATQPLSALTSRRGFKLRSAYSPSGDQPEAIGALLRELRAGAPRVSMKGATGTGKTYVMANVIAGLGRPTLVLAPNKVLAAQLYAELRAFFPENAVTYFVSNFDYYRPESFSAVSDTYREKLSRVNENVDALRHEATCALFERRDTIVVATVSCIFGLGVPERYLERAVLLARGQRWGSPDELLERLHALEYEQHASPTGRLSRAQFRVLRPARDGCGSERAAAADGLGAGGGGTGAAPAGGAERAVIEVAPAFSSERTQHLLRVELVRTARAWRVDAIRASGGGGGGGGGGSGGGGGGGGAPGSAVARRAGGGGGAREGDGGRQADAEDGGATAPATLPEAVLYPASHHVSARDDDLPRVLAEIESELEARVAQLAAEGRFAQAERLLFRVREDLAALRAGKRVRGIENYSRHLDARRGPGEPPRTLLDYMPADDWLLLVDESHLTVAQLGAMFEGDRRRKASLIEHGFRLPSAADNRPLTADEFWARVPQAVLVSATPGAEVRMCERAAPPDAAAEPADEGAAQPSPSSAPPLPPPLPIAAELRIRPTGIPDPTVSVVDSAAEGGCEDHLLAQLSARQARGERALVTTLTKRSAEALTRFLRAHGVRAEWLHADVPSGERLVVLERLRAGDADAVVGCNLLREGLDLPHVSLVAVVDAEKSGFLRSATSLVQIIGRAARHVNGHAIFYSAGGVRSAAMEQAMAETAARRAAQLRYNAQHGVTPRQAAGAAGAASERDELLQILRTTGSPPRAPPGGALDGAERELYDAVRAFRDAAARREARRPFAVLCERTMQRIATAAPRSIEALGAVRGIGPKRLERYGDDLVRLVRAHADAVRARDAARAAEARVDAGGALGLGLGAGEAGAALEGDDDDALLDADELGALIATELAGTARSRADASARVAITGLAAELSALERSGQGQGARAASAAELGSRPGAADAGRAEP